MNPILCDESATFAPFDLVKTPKFDKNTDKVKLAINSYELANSYYVAAALLFKCSHELMPVVLSNVSFSCELYLKALLFGYEIDFGNTHGLKNLFDKLPHDIKDYVSRNIDIDNREKEFQLCLAEQNDAFVTYRYMNEVKSIAANPRFLFAFAHILKFVYETLTEEQNTIKDRSDDI